MDSKKEFLKIPANRITALIVMDVMSIIVASFGALYIRYDFQISSIDPAFVTRWGRTIIWNILFTLLIYAGTKLYKSVWRYASANELLNIVLATSLAASAQFALCTVTDQYMPRTYYPLFWFLLTGFTCSIRFSYRLLRLVNSKRYNKKQGNAVNVLLIGAGAAGNSILKEIESSQYIHLNVKCIVDDGEGCHGKYLRGVPIIGGRDKIIDAVGQYGIDEIIFAIPSANAKVKREFIDICKETGCVLFRVPYTYKNEDYEKLVDDITEIIMKYNE